MEPGGWLGLQSTDGRQRLGCSQNQELACELPPLAQRCHTLPTFLAHFAANHNPLPCSTCAALVQIHARKHKMAADVDLYQLAKDLPGLSGALHWVSVCEVAESLDSVGSSARLHQLAKDLPGLSGLVRWALC